MIGSTLNGPSQDELNVALVGRTEVLFDKDVECILIDCVIWKEVLVFPIVKSIENAKTLVWQFAERFQNWYLV